MRVARRLLARGRDPLLGLVLLSSIGSCQVPKPQLPSIGELPPAPHRTAPAVVAGAPDVAAATVVAGARPLDART